MKTRFRIAGRDSRAETVTLETAADSRSEAVELGQAMGLTQVTATVDASWARDYYFKHSGRYVSVITDGGMSAGGDICKALACGADAVMVGSAFARAEEAPGGGNHWGMATPHHNLPRGTRRTGAPQG